MKISFYGIDRFYKNHKTDFMNIMNSVYEQGQVFGSESAMLESELAVLTNRKFAVTTGSCTDALFFALKGLGIKKGDEVLVTSFSFIASASAIIRAEAIPVFVDIDADSFLMNMDDLRKKITKKTKAVIGVHLFGQTLNIDEIEHICRQNNLYLIEDCAQGFGARSDSRMAGSMGDVSCLSFDPTKIINGFGSGGALLTNDEKMYNYVKKTRYHGKNNEGQYEFAGYNSRIPSPQCALIRHQIKELLNERIERHRQIAELYNSNIHHKDIILPEQLNGNFHIFHKYVIQSNKRHALKEYLDSKGIQTMIHYPNPLPDLNVFANNSIANNINVSRNVSEKVLSLPIYPELTENEIGYICECVNSFN